MNQSSFNAPKAIWNFTLKYIKYYFPILSLFLSSIGLSQCAFQYISNDTIFQDYIDFVYARKASEKIITIGSHINRGIINDSIFNSPVFQSFDYCGNTLKKITYKFIGNYKLKHTRIPTHDTYKDEPIGITSIRIKEDEFLIVDKAFDTLTKVSVMILIKINENGELISYKTLDLDNNEANFTTIKNVLLLRNGKFLVLLWDYSYDYTFFYFDESSDFLYKKSFSMGRGIRSIKEADQGDFICTSLAYDNMSFQFYRFDTSGNIKWISTPPYNTLGSARDILIENNKIYVTGGVSYGMQGIFGVFLICDMDGNILKEFRYNSFNCQQRFCSALVASENSFIISGYVEHCESSNKSGSDLAILKIDSTGAIIWDKLYDFKSALGTSGPQGYFTDYGGFSLVKANDGGMIFNGKTKYNRLIPGGVLHDDALLIKTEPLISASTNIISDLQYILFPNPIIDDLNIAGPINLIKIWTIYSYKGDLIQKGRKWVDFVSIKNYKSGLYVLKIIDQNNYEYFIKFVKI